VTALAKGHRGAPNVAAFERDLPFDYTISVFGRGRHFGIKVSSLCWHAYRGHWSKFSSLLPTDTCTSGTRNVPGPNKLMFAEDNERISPSFPFTPTGVHSPSIGQGLLLVRWFNASGPHCLSRRDKMPRILPIQPWFWNRFHRLVGTPHSPVSCFAAGKSSKVLV
jgi:hypothetical protein